MWERMESHHHISSHIITYDHEHVYPKQSMYGINTHIYTFGSFIGQFVNVGFLHQSDCLGRFRTALEATGVPSFERRRG